MPPRAWQAPHSVWGIGGLALTLRNGGIPAFGSCAMFGDSNPGVTGGDAASKDAMVLQGFKLYKNQRGINIATPSRDFLSQRQNRKCLNLLPKRTKE